VLTLSTSDLGDHAEIRVADNGTGITPEIADKIYHPFFTTRRSGEGTGLGLSLTHAIVTQGHQGRISMTTAPGKGTEFVITLPKTGGTPMPPARTPVKRGAAILALLTGLVVAPSTARAAVDYVADVEAVGLGQGGAFIAAPYTPMAIWYNPGALAHGQGLRLEIGGSVIHSPLSYVRAPDSAMSSYPKVVNQDPVLPSGLVAAVYDFKVKDLAVALAAYTPDSNHYVFPDDGPQRFQTIGGSYRLIHVHAAAAYRLFGKIAIGVALGGSYFSATQRTLLSGAPGGDPESPTWTIPVDIAITAPVTFTSNFGISARPIPELAIGASVMPPFDVHGSGTAQITLPPTLAALGSIAGNRINATLPFPAVVRAGVRYTPIPRFSVELAAVREGWGRLATIDIEPLITVTAPILRLDHSPLKPISLVRNFRDAYSVRLGVEGSPTSLLTLRGGAWFESSAARPGYLDISTIEGNKFGTSLGASFAYRSFAVDVSYSHVFVPELTESASKIQIINVLAPQNTRPIGNGTYEFSFDVLQLGLRAQLGR
jgi:long-subunit fatty acid transport protein